MALGGLGPLDCHDDTMVDGGKKDRLRDGLPNHGGCVSF